MDDLVGADQSPSMVENDEFVFDQDAGCYQVRNRCDDAARRKIAAAVIVAADDQDAGVRSFRHWDETLAMACTRMQGLVETVIN